MNRRNFIKNTGMAGVMLPLMGNWTIKALAATPLTSIAQLSTDTDHVLVMIQLGGGNDGLNTFVPLNQYDRLQNARPQVILPENSLLSLTGVSDAALHPAMAGMQALYNEGKMSIVQSVGYPNPDYSHFRSSDIWLTAANSNQYLNTGWMGRYLNYEYPNFPMDYPNATMPDPLGIEIGYNQSLMFQGPLTGMGFTISDPQSFYQIVQGIQSPLPDTPAAEQLAYVRLIARQSQIYNAVISSAYNSINPTQNYPDTELANKLKIVARLIAGGLKSKVYLVHHNGFDTHSDQVADNHILGEHANLLGDLSGAIGAFMTDINALGIGDRIMTMTFSEFGRRIIANDSNGTDHGTAAPMFVVGNKVNGGIVGSNPFIPLNPTEDDNLAMQHDFRSVYSTMLLDWFCVPPSDLDNTMLQDFPTLPLIGSSDCVGSGIHTQNQQAGQSFISASPNPITDYTEISIETEGGYTMVQIFDTSGQLIAVPLKGNLARGTHRFGFASNHLPAGMYYCRLQNGSIQQVKTLVKI
ncbi:MAG: DUF1501 domain-containing protein [Sphingobacteriales bacterium]|nr:DUF1501 domain-containing protein [Sphingobacteriales bacterium]